MTYISPYAKAVLFIDEQNKTTIRNCVNYVKNKKEEIELQQERENQMQGKKQIENFIQNQKKR